MCLKCKISESRPDFGETFVEVIEPQDAQHYPPFFQRAAQAWLASQAGGGPQCLACDHTFTAEAGAAALVCVAPPKTRHLFITGVCAECFPVIAVEQLAAHVAEVAGLPHAIRRRYH